MPVDPEIPVRLATRGSALALAQAREVERLLRQAHPGLRVELVVLQTTGDQRPEVPLWGPGNSQPVGVFTRELEEALLSDRADVAVHSLKDLPTTLPEGLSLAAVLPRQDVREVLLYRSREAAGAPDPGSQDWSPGGRQAWFGGSQETLPDLPQRSIVATSSSRRRASVEALRPDLQCVPIRGNVGTRLRKLWASLDFDATLLAAAGLVRLGWDLSPKGRLRIDPRLPAAARAALEPPPEGIQGTLIDPLDMLPAPGQGAIGLEIRSGDDRCRTLCRDIHHRNTGVAVEAERSFLAALGGGCQLPVGAWGRVVGHQIVLTVEWYRDGQRFTAEDRAPVQEAARLGARIGSTVKRDR